MNPSVSIVVPVYNSGGYLAPCLESIATQTLADIEIVCIDDGSSDGSSTVLDEFAARDSRVKVIHKSNAGYGAAMNDGIAACTGEYVGLVEPDDFVDPFMFERLYVQAKRHNADVVKGDFYAYSGKGTASKRAHMEICPGKEYYGHLLDSTKSEALFFCIMMTWEGIYRRSFLIENGIRHNETPGASFQDNGFWFQVFCRARRVFFINEAHYFYRMDAQGSSISSATAALRIMDEFSYVRAFLNQDPALWTRMAGVYSYFLFDNCIARLSHVAPEQRAVFTQKVGSAWAAAQRKGEADRNLLPNLLLEQLDVIARDPGSWRAEDYPSIEARSWREVEERRGRTEILRDSISPYQIVKDYAKCIVNDSTFPQKQPCRSEKRA